MHHPLRFATPLLASFALLVGCASDGVEVSTTFDPLTAFPAQARYAWDTRANALPDDPRLAQLDLDRIITEAADEEFALHGYHRETAAAAPEFHLSYEVAVHSWIGADNSRSVASLSLLLTEASTGRRVWLGFGRAEVQMGLSRSERKQRMRRAIASILEGFPPKQRGR